MRLARLIRVRLDRDGGIARPERSAQTPGWFDPPGFPQLTDGEAAVWYRCEALLHTWRHDPRDDLSNAEWVQPYLAR